MEKSEKNLLLRVCKNCVLPETFPGIQFDNTGVCNFCRDYEGMQKSVERKTEYRHRFETLLKEYKGKSTYDAIMCYSGGKDSTYTLYTLRNKYELNILAISFDNSFLPEQTFLNIHKVVEKLGVDHIFFKPRFDIIRKIFSNCVMNDLYSAKAMERASTICTSCMGIIKYSTLRMALEKNIPFVAYGWSPGQAPVTSSVLKNNPQMVKKMQDMFYTPLYRIAGNAIEPYFLKDEHFNGSYHFPYYIHPLAFLDYNEEEVYRVISHMEWKAPEDVDANSTNCLLNSFANVEHKKRFGFHPYAFELANLVREGYMERTVALERLNRQENPHVISMIKERMSLNGDFSTG